MLVDEVLQVGHGLLVTLNQEKMAGLFVDPEFAVGDPFFDHSRGVGRTEHVLPARHHEGRAFHLVQAVQRVVGEAGVGGIRVAVDGPGSVRQPLLESVELFLVLVEIGRHDYLDFEPAEALDQLIGASIHYRIAIGPNAGKKALTLRTVPARLEPFASTLLARQPGFSLHAATRCEANQRDKLEKLCRYITRPAIANERLSMNEREPVIDRFKQPFRDGTTQVVLDPLEPPEALL